MLLFERVRLVASQLAGSQKELGRKLGLGQATFQGYLNEKRQDNLWPLLPAMLMAYPVLRREWLYFGEGEMLAAGEAVADGASAEGRALTEDLCSQLPLDHAIRGRLARTIEPAALEVVARAAFPHAQGKAYALLQSLLDGTTTMSVGQFVAICAVLDLSPEQELARAVREAATGGIASPPALQRQPMITDAASEAAADSDSALCKVANGGDH